MSSKSRGRKEIGDAIHMPSHVNRQGWNPTFYKNIKPSGFSKRHMHVNRRWDKTLVPQIFDQTVEHNQKMILVLGGHALSYEKWKGKWKGKMV